MSTITTTPPGLAQPTNNVLTARLYTSAFKLSDSNFYSASLISDGRIYYTLCSHGLDSYARVYRYDPASDDIEELADIGEIVGEAGTKSIPQGKSHSPYYEHAGKLYFATHYGYYNPSADRESPGIVPEGYQPYPGGHFIEHDIAAGTFRDLGKAPPEEGILTFHMDAGRGRLYGLTWPRGHFISHDLSTGQVRDHGRVSRGGELGAGDQYFCLCRCFGLDPRTGKVYWTNADGEIRFYDPDHDKLSALAEPTLRREVFGQWDTTKPGHQGYNWRHIWWYEPWQCFLGVHPKSGYLFRFEPEAGELELIERLAAEPLRRDGSFEPFRYGYLTLELGPDGETIYYVTGDHGLIAEDGRKVKNTLRLVTYHLPTGRYQDHGVIRLEDGRYPTLTQSLVVHPNGRLFSVPWIEKLGQGQPEYEAGEEHKRKGKGPGHQCDLISFANPLMG